MAAGRSSRLVSLDPAFGRMHHHLASGGSPEGHRPKESSESLRGVLCRSVPARRSRVRRSSTAARGAVRRSAAGPRAASAAPSVRSTSEPSRPGDDRGRRVRGGSPVPDRSIGGARSGGNPGLLRPVDDPDLHVGFDVDLAGEPDIRRQVAFAASRSFSASPMGGTLPSSTSTRQVVHRALPPQRWRMSMPASSIARTSFFPASTSTAFSPWIVTVGIGSGSPELQDGRGCTGRRWPGACPGRIRPDRGRDACPDEPTLAVRPRAAKANSG